MSQGPVRPADRLTELLLQEGIRLTERKAQEVYEKLSSILSYVPRVGVLGKTGVGKSTLCNALFGSDTVRVSHVEPGTVEPQEVFLRLTDDRGMVLLDCPGVGADDTQDVQYAELYRALLPQLDLILWVVKADDRAYALDERFYKSVIQPSLPFAVPFIVVVNQVDLVHPPRDWDVSMRQPGRRQVELIGQKLAAVAGLFGLSPGKVLPVSAAEKYNLVALLDAIVEALPPEKQYAFVREAREEVVSPATREKADASFREIAKKALLGVGVTAAVVAVVVYGPVVVPAIISLLGAAGAKDSKREDSARQT